MVEKNTGRSVRSREIMKIMYVILGIILMSVVGFSYLFQPNTTTPWQEFYSQNGSYYTSAVQNIQNIQYTSGGSISINSPLFANNGNVTPQFISANCNNVSSQEQSVACNGAYDTATDINTVPPSNYYQYVFLVPLGNAYLILPNPAVGAPSTYFQTRIQADLNSVQQTSGVNLNILNFGGVFLVW